MAEIDLGTTSRHPDRIYINVGRAEVPIDTVSRAFALQRILDSRRDAWEIVVTPNLYHLRLVRSAPGILPHYKEAALSLSDGWPVAWLAGRVSGRRVERVVGADLLQEVIASPGRQRPLVLVGGAPGDELKSLMQSCRQNGWVVSHEPAHRKELTNSTSRADLVRRVSNAANGGIAILGIGAPRQEELALEIAEFSGRGVILCLGMSINFSSGVARRAPQVLRLLRLEWAFRALSEPRRLLSRYARDGLLLPRLVHWNPQQSKRANGYKSYSLLKRGGRR